MAALLPILQEILPMLMPGPVQIVRAEDVGRREEGEEEEEEQEEEEEGEQGPNEDEKDLGEKNGKGEDDERGGEQEDDTSRRPAIKNDRADDADRAEPLPGHTRRRIRPPPHNGVSLRDAIVNKSSTLCASVLTVQPGSATVVFHNGEQEALVYAVAGSAVLATLPEEDDDFDGEDNAFDADDAAASRSSKAADPTTHPVWPGDFALIPAWTEHQVRNVGEGAVVWVVVRNGAEPTVVPLRGWGGEQMEE